MSLKLLSLRKIIGANLAVELENTFGRPATDAEFVGEAQRRFGERGLQFAKKGKDNLNSPNLLSDEEMLVIAVLTAIIEGREIYVVTMDTDIIDQFGKLFLLIKEHYRSMLAAEIFAASPARMPFRTIEVTDQPELGNFWAEPSILELRLPETEFDVLPEKFQSTVAHCIWLGRDQKTPRISYSCFTIERDVARVLCIKAATSGLSTDLHSGRNCTIRTERFTADQHQVIATIGKEKVFRYGDWGTFGADDYHNVLLCCEEFTCLTQEINI